MTCLDVADFAEPVSGRPQTLYLLSKDGAGNAAPLVAGLTDQILRDAVRTAELHGGRLDPVLLAVLDEAARTRSSTPQLLSTSSMAQPGTVPVFWNS